MRQAEERERQAESRYQDDDGDGSGEAPQQLVIDGDPAEVWVSITLGVQPHCQT